MTEQNTYPDQYQSSTSATPTPGNYQSYQQPPASNPNAPASASAAPHPGSPVMAQAVMYGTPQAHILVPGGQPVMMMTHPYQGGLWPPWPCQTQCPFCQANVTTRTNVVPGTVTWLSCLGLALVGCWLGCCLIPFCIDGLQDTEHFCPNCNRLIGTKRQMDC